MFGCLPTAICYFTVWLTATRVLCHCCCCCPLSPGSYNCDNGACVCPAGTQECNGLCVDVTSDLANCGRCGNVSGAGTDAASMIATIRRSAVTQHMQHLISCLTASGERVSPSPVTFA
jgi:hypothetical protein